MGIRNRGPEPFSTPTPKTSVPRRLSAAVFLLTFLFSTSTARAFVFPSAPVAAPPPPLAAAAASTARRHGGATAIAMAPNADANGGASGSGGDRFVGFDLGTSGARVSVTEKRPYVVGGRGGEAEYIEVFSASLAWDGDDGGLRYDDAGSWREAVDRLLALAAVSGSGDDAPSPLSRVRALCVSGTSATCLVVDRDTLEVTREPRMYNYDVVANSSSAAAREAAERALALIATRAPLRHTARAATGSLAKLVSWAEESKLDVEREALCHQADYIAASLMRGEEGGESGAEIASDWHNCLKLGYDVRSLTYPPWMIDLLRSSSSDTDPSRVLPSRVVSPGEPLGRISPALARRFGLNHDVVVVGGTTDSNAAFFAAAGSRPEYGTAVTSLGSTLAIKQLSRAFVEDASRGIYSHRFPRFGGGGDTGGEEAWLVGGASNVGCAVLRQENFTNSELAELSSEIDPSTDSPLSYYPLTGLGERFPTADSDKRPVLEPKPDGRREYLHAILQGIGDVERDGFRVLGELGADPPRPGVVLTAGGGSRNDSWIEMRQRRLREDSHGGGGGSGPGTVNEVVVRRADNTEASYGAALLAAASFKNE